MKRKYFGTDGIRGRANTFPITAEVALQAAMAAGANFRNTGHRNKVVIGKDTRLSCYMLEQAMTAGFAAVGFDVILLGPLPTPAVAMVTRSMRADLGVMISASHNAYTDNGIKFFGPDGYKFSDEVEAKIEASLDAIRAGNGAEHMVDATEVGNVERLNDVRGRYMELVKQSFPRHLSLEGVKVVVDCAHGAAYRVAPKVLYELGAEVITLGCKPDGTNINNQVGATSPQALCAKVKETGAQLGIALDGDADRIILVDENAQVVDGDQIMGMIAKNWLRRERLSGGGIVSTVMSNMGLEKSLNAQGLTLERTSVGDKNVLQRMRTGGFNFGGEQSGHMIMTDFATTGDGLLAGLQVLAELVEQQVPASTALSVFEPFPQILQSVRFSGADPSENAAFKKAVVGFEEKLGSAGRILIRKSGTEPVMRVMAEGEDAALVQSIVSDLCDQIQNMPS
ncbi:MAG: phosphoglucosamine mutase [Alphaproteobacteria bacterium]